MSGEAAAAILSRLSALGARIECRGGRVVLRAGNRPVPAGLIAAAREAKAELAKTLNSPKILNNGEDEHLRAPTVENPRVSAASIEGAQPPKNERLRGVVSDFGDGEDCRAGPPVAPDPPPKVLAEDAHVSAFDEAHTNPRFLEDSAPKALKRPVVERIRAVEHLRATWGEVAAERAATVEYDGNIPREWAEGFARLDPDRPPGDVPLRRWQQFIDDVGRFLDSPFCAVAAAIGWGPLELFGCDRDRPFARIDQCGLLWLLNGDRLVMLAGDAATIETATGARQTYRRKPSAPGRVLAWELAR